MFKRLSILAIFSIFSLMVSPPALSITEINYLDGNDIHRSRLWATADQPSVCRICKSTHGGTSTPDSD